MYLSRNWGNSTSKVNTANKQNNSLINEVKTFTTDYDISVD